MVPVVGFVPLQPLIDPEKVPGSPAGSTVLVRVTFFALRVFVSVQVTEPSGIVNEPEVVPDTPPTPMHDSDDV
jgi:hypothetical protein